MTSRPQDPTNIDTARVQALVHELARGYLNRDIAEVADVDGRLGAELREGVPVGSAASGLSAEVRQALPVESAGLMCEDWIRTAKCDNAFAEVLPAAGLLAAEFAPPGLREDLGHAFDRLVAGDAGLFTRPAAAGLTGVAGAHLYAVVTAAAIEYMHPMIRNQARVLLEGQIRNSQAAAAGMPVAEAVAYVSDTEAEQILLEVLPWVAEMTEPRHELMRRDLRAFVQLYLLDHPVVGPAEKADLERRLGDRMAELAATVGSPGTGKTPPRARYGHLPQHR